MPDRSKCLLRNILDIFTMLSQESQEDGWHSHVNQDNSAQESLEEDTARDILWCLYESAL